MSLTYFYKNSEMSTINLSILNEDTITLHSISILSLMNICVVETAFPSSNCGEMHLFFQSCSVSGLLWSLITSYCHPFHRSLGEKPFWKKKKSINAVENKKPGFYTWLKPIMSVPTITNIFLGLSCVICILI